MQHPWSMYASLKSEATAVGDVRTCTKGRRASHGGAARKGLSTSVTTLFTSVTILFTSVTAMTGVVKGVAIVAGEGGLVMTTLSSAQRVLREVS